ncbi:site-specific integrase [Mycobacterium sp.]|uniref:tyrosine-type recombinase/integrase n=1 Tax=Mycobacterium sp. TaxID=1785 RepID=UPI00333E7B5F
MRSRDELLRGLRALLYLRAIRPSYIFFLTYHPSSLYDLAREVIEPEAFNRCYDTGKTLGFSGARLNDGMRTIVRMVLHTGCSVADLREADFLEMRDQHRRAGRPLLVGTAPAWDILGALGILTESRSFSAVLRRQGQGSTAELVDSYGIRCRPVRDVLVRYLDEKRPAMDYSSFRSLVTVLAGLFWADIEKHHPSIDTLHLPLEVADAWKQRLRMIVSSKGNVKPRRFYLTHLVRIRGFYLDIAEWALEDPTWAQWAVPCPIRRGETDGLTKEKRKVIADMHQRIRERLPHLDTIVDAVDSHRRGAADLLAQASATAVGSTFQHAGHTYSRLAQYKVGRAARHMNEPAVIVQRLDTGDRHDATKSEADAFWSWAVVETLRHTGVRLEELLEITQLAVVQYQLPDTGETVPLLQIVPSKNDEERVLLIGPELANVLATIITRLRNHHGGKVPAVSRYDPSERIDGPPLPHLFQHFSTQQSRNTVMSMGDIHRLLDLAVAHAEITDATGAPVRFRPHDFRRMFATDAVTGGLPVHIAAKVLGHASLETTQHYLAVFPDEMIRAYRTYIDKRRSIRPEAEYREPTNDEWAEFRQHFHERKLELGTCGRPYGTPCKHEHACIRCPMLRSDPKQRGRLVEIIRNLEDRITEARLNGWLGEVQGLQTSRNAAAKKLVGLDRAITQLSQGATERTDLGIPTIIGKHHQPT